MRRLLLLSILLFPVGCMPERSTSSTPVPAARINGSYILTVTPSSVCKLPIASAQWVVVATTSAAPMGGSIKVTLPGGNPGIELSLSYEADLGVDVVTGVLNVTGDPITLMGVTAMDQTHRVLVMGAAHGNVTDAAGRGEIHGGFDGPISVSRPRDRRSDSLGSCAAADHTWSLTAGQ
jgi:hypothetical protein